jgi:hypothetical protein
MCGPKRQVIMVTNGSTGCVFMIVIISARQHGEPDVKPVAA